MRKALVDTSVLLAVSLVAIGVQVARALGAAAQVPRWTGLSRMLERSWEPAAVLALALVTALVLAFGPGDRSRRARAVGWTIGLLGIVSFLLLDAPLGFVLLGTGKIIHGPRGAPARGLARAA